MDDSGPILRFYRLEDTDSEGRTLTEIWTWNHVQLERTHDYIQWLFPLRRRSSFNWAAPVLTEETVKAFLDDSELRERFKRSFRLMLNFYGLALVEPPDGPVSIMTGPEFAVRSRQWLRADDHNHLRLSRILASMHLLGFAAYSRALFQCLDGISAQNPGCVTDETLGYWRRAGSDRQDG
ncbi:MAG: opioid growth factor receptor-related protein [Thermoanaerobaculia bacterium]